MKVIAIDHGNGHVKVKSDFKEFALPSAIAHVREAGEESATGGKLQLSVYESAQEKGKEYVWGMDVLGCKTFLATKATEDRYKKKEYVLLSEFALATALPDEETAVNNILVVTGCPSQEKGTSLETELEEVFKGAHVVNINGQEKMISVSNVFIIPQPLGTVMSLYLNEQGYVQDKSYEKAHIGIIDIGSGTTDIDSIKALRRQNGDTESIQMGASDIYQRIADYINRVNPKAKAKVQEVESQIAEDVFKKGRISVDISEVKKQVLEETAEYLINTIDQRWKNRMEMDKIILTGGGAALLAPYFKKWDADIIVTPDCQTANAEGFYRYGLFKARSLKNG